MIGNFPACSPPIGLLIFSRMASRRTPESSFFRSSFFKTLARSPAVQKTTAKRDIKVAYIISFGMHAAGRLCLEREGLSPTSRIVSSFSR